MAVEHNCRLPLDAFLGRDPEVADALERLSASRFVTLTGGPGIGKTRLATELARRVIDGASRVGVDAVWWVDARDAQSGVAVLRAMARTLGAMVPGESDADAAAETLQRALILRPATLVIVDNLEQVPAGELGALGWLLERTPQLWLLTTSQRRLRVRGEHVVRLSPLARDAESETGRSPAAALLAARIEQVSVLGDDVDDDLEALANALDGVPLALELAAARCSLLSPRQLVERLGSRLDALHRSGAERRHATLRSAIAWSWELLRAGERSALAALSVCRGGAPLDGALEVIGHRGGDPLERLQALRDRSLVVTDPGAAHPRITLYSAVDEFAGEKLAASDDDGPVSRHIAWMGALAREARPAFDTRGRADAVARLLPERANLAAALDRGIERLARGRLASLRDLLAIAETIVHLDLVTSTTHDAGAALERTLDALVAHLLEAADGEALESDDVDRLASSFALLARAWSMAGDHARSAATLDRADALGTRSPHAIAELALRRAQLSLVGRDLDAVAAGCTPILDDERLGDALRARAAGLHARAEMLRSNHTLAESLCARGLPLARRSGDPTEELSLLIDLSRVGLYQARLDDVLRWGELALERADEVVLRQARAYALNLVALADFEAGRTDEATPRQREAVEILRRLGHRHYPPMHLSYADMLAEAGAHDDAREAIAEAEAAHSHVDDPTFAEFHARARARIAWANGDHAHAAVTVDERIGLADAAGDAHWREALESERIALDLHANGAESLDEGRLERARADFDPGIAARVDAHPRSVLRATWLAHAAAHAPETAARLAGFLEGLASPPPDQDRRGPWLTRSSAVRAAHRRLVAYLGAVGVASSTLSPVVGDVLEVEDGCRRFRPPRSEWVDIARKHKLRSMLDALVSQRVARGAVPIPLHELTERVWPGEKILPEAAANRVYFSISTLRKLGLADVVETTPDGYRIAPPVDVRKV